MSIDHKDLYKIVEYIMGTCQSMSEVLVKFGYEDMDLDLEAAMYIDDRIFCCEQCEWWFEIAEMDEDEEWVCEDCIKYG